MTTPAVRRVSPGRREIRYTAGHGTACALLQRPDTDHRVLGTLATDIVAVHRHWTDWPERVRDGLLLLASIAADLDRAEYRRIADGLEEEWVHGDAWYRWLDVLVDEQATLARLADGDPSSARAAEVADVEAHRDEALTRLLGPVGGPG